MVELIVVGTDRSGEQLTITDCVLLELLQKDSLDFIYFGCQFGNIFPQFGLEQTHVMNKFVGLLHS
jgi:hypothetical protein